MDDDLLWPDEQHLGGSPIASQSSLGDRITWGPSASSILANVPKPKHPRPIPAVLPYALPNVQAVKRSSVNAGLGSPTCPGGAGAGATTSDCGGTARSSGSTSYSTGSSTTAASRLAKRTRRTRQSTSASCLVFGNPSGQQLSPTGRSQSLDMTTDAMFGELERRLQARQEVAAAQKAEQERMLRLQSEDQENARQHERDNNGKGKQTERTALKPAVSVVMEEETCVMSQGVAKMELEENQQHNHVHSPVASKSRPALASKSDNILGSLAMYKREDPAGPSFKPAVKTVADTSDQVHSKLIKPSTVPRPETPDSHMADETKQSESFCTNIDPSFDANVTYTDEISVSYSPSSRSQRTILTKVLSGEVIPDSQAQSGEGDGSKTLTGLEKEESMNVDNEDDEDAYWGDDASMDRSMEVALSQMVIPEAPSHSQTGNKKEDKRSDSRNSVLMELERPISQESKKNSGSGKTLKPSGKEEEEEKWSGYSRRDRKSGGKPSPPAEETQAQLGDVQVKSELVVQVKQEPGIAETRQSVKSSTATAVKPGLSSRPVGTTPNQNATTLKMKTHPAGLPKKAPSLIKSKAGASAARPPSTSAVKLPCSNSAISSSQSRHAPTSVSTTSTSTSTRTGTLNRTNATSSDKLRVATFKPFKPPTIKNLDLAKMAKQSWKDTKVKAGKAPPLNEADFPGVDFDDFDLNESF